MKPAILLFLLFPLLVPAQSLLWKNVDSLYGPLPSSVKVYLTEQNHDSSPFRAFYVIADIKNKKLDYLTDTTNGRRFTPGQFYERNKAPLVVVNGTFFSFATNQNLNVVIKDGKLVGNNIHSIPGRGKDTLTYRHPIGSALGISKKRKADVAWLLTDSTSNIPLASQFPLPLIKDSFYRPGIKYLKEKASTPHHSGFEKWKMQTAIGGGPVLVQAGEVKITNNEEWKFAGKAIHDKHPRTAMGYTADRKLIILVIEGRNPQAAGASLIQTAQI
ncbi:MAG: phosphodiester glycosidase family protein, partial [Flavisolibacter sp.]